MSTAATALQPAVVGPDLVLSHRQGRLVLRTPEGTLLGEHTKAVDAWKVVDALDLAEVEPLSAAA